ncbi:YoaK family protein [Jiangella alkaliphila]|uniref:Uncharacterized membrane protein YoaK, UPF0700 family n=1 Tax=Jiangella alkaliphila TaxID=419479 RepID=A0A1H2KYM0_9ACTN|nr:YoaK family protein [Jiangella alkaliphila]SDU73632.1 Uncharacterized membrane protein YoaK, UPF0700 family [Jiangella alkaliphila]
MPTIVRSRDETLIPVLLFGLTAVTGVVDAVSYLALGHVFVANMTGNVIFLGFGIAGAADVSAAASVAALLAFVLGALAGGRLSRHLQHAGTPRHLAVVTAAGLAGTTAALVLSLLVGDDSAAARYALIVVLAATMGLQNASARALALPDLTTTVLTQSITGLAADSRWGSGGRQRAGRRLGSVATMLAGALAGALLLRGGGPAAALGVAVLLQAAVATIAYRIQRS